MLNIASAYPREPLLLSAALREISLIEQAPNFSLKTFSSILEPYATNNFAIPFRIFELKDLTSPSHVAIHSLKVLSKT